MNHFHRYDEIIHLPHPVSQTHPRMGRLERAAQFSPFAALTGYDDAARETARLTDAQREIFETVCTDLKESSILCSIDNYVLANFAIAVDRLQNIERSINATPEKMLEKSVMAAKDRYTKDFFRGCSELCLSPQSRAKMALANANAEKEKSNPLLKIIEGLNDDGEDQQEL